MSRCSVEPSVEVDVEVARARASIIEVDVEYSSLYPADVEVIVLELVSVEA
jgi:hypothetical protein